MNKIKSVLIANRAEIAVRIIHALKEREIRSVSIFKSSENELPHVRLADKSICLGDGSLSETYLNIDKIIQIAKDNNVDAIHPGYGFLSENAEFAKKIIQAGLVFIGPSPLNIEQMGDKITSKKIASEAGLPLVPGFDLDQIDMIPKNKSSQEEIFNKLESIGLPILIKATAGGGGKGMKRVDSLEQFIDSFESAKREAKNAFGNEKVFVEKLVENPRHIEIQVICDQNGHCYHLFDRECSIQRRHQKVVEESPSPFVLLDTKNKMAKAALSLCQKINYIGVGTVEFLVDEDQHFYFLEMNTRLQVEHPVTEMVTGIDLVSAQIDIAQGEDIDYSNVTQRGHSIELRVYAEDPYNNFLPQIGKLKFIKGDMPPNVRFDFGYESGNELTTDYDPMLGKIIVWGEDRAKAILKLKIVLDQFILMGVQSNLSFLRNLLTVNDFKMGNTPTSFIEQHQELLTRDDEVPEEVIAAILNVSSASSDSSSNKQLNFDNQTYNMYSILNGWRI